MDGDFIGKYRVLKHIASGGMGEVYLARQEGPAGFTKPAVLKRILDHLGRDAQFVDMFLNEARLAALLSHPNIVQIFELGEEDGVYFIAMEFIHGKTLKAIKSSLYKRGDVFPPVHAARIVAQALHGLHYAHHATGPGGETLNIVHRDMSPDNVMVGFNGQVKVLDFGIAKATTAISTTRTGTVKGKYAYMAPEQLNAGEIDGRTDLYSCGVVLYEMLSGQRPFSAPTEPALVNAVLTETPQPLRERVPSIPEDLDAIIMKSLAKSARQRFQTAEEMALALEAWAQNHGGTPTNGATGQFLREAFPDEAADNPALQKVEEGAVIPGPRPSKPRPGPSISRPDSLHTDETRMEASRKSSGASAALFAVAGAVFAVVLGVAFLKFTSAEPSPSTPTSPTTVKAPTPPPEAPLPPPREPEVVALPPVHEPGEVTPPQVPEPTSPAATATPKSSRPGKGTGSLDLRVNPWAEVFEGGKSLGVTPLPPFELPAGKHTLTLINTDLGTRRQIKVNIAPGKRTSETVDLLD